MPDLKNITLPSGTTYALRDSRVDSIISQGTKWVGTTTTAIADGSTTSVITINGESHTAEIGDITAYNIMEFIWNGTIWQEFGSTGSLKELAFKDASDLTASTPVPATFSTTVSVDTAGGTATVEGIDSVGSMPSFTVQNETLVITAGSTPTKASAVTVKTSDATYTASTSVVSTTNASGSIAAS